MLLCCERVPGRSLIRILCDGELWCTVHTAVFGRQLSLPASCATLQQLEEWFYDLEYRSAKNYCFHRLSRQAMLSTQLSRTLRDRLVTQRTVDRLLDELVSLGALNDKEWVASFMRIHKQRRYGPKAIKAKLAARGVTCEEAEGKVTLEEQQESISHLLETRFRSKNLADFKERQKVIASLMRRGFDYEVVMRVLKNRSSDKHI